MIPAGRMSGYGRLRTSASNLVSACTRALAERWRPLRIGLALGEHAVRAVLVRGATILWADEQAVAGEAALESTCSALLREATRRYHGASSGWRRILRRPRLQVAFAPGLAQLKRIDGIPPLRDPALLTRLVREGASRFFLDGAAGLLTSRVRVAGENHIWAAAYDPDVVAALTRSTRATGWRLGDVLPAAVGLSYALQGTELTWYDGPWVLELQVDGTQLLQVRRGRARATAPDSIRGVPVVALALLGDDCRRYAAAYGVAIAARTRGSAVLDNLSPDLPASPPPSWRLVSATLVAMLALGWGAVAPALEARRAVRRAEQSLSQTRMAVREAQEARADLLGMGTALADVEDFAGTRYSAVQLLADITAALPEGTALVALRIDSTSGSAVVLGPHASAVVGTLDAVAGITSAELIGPIAREAGGTPAAGESVSPTVAAAGQTSSSEQAGELERATIQFRLAYAPHAAHASPGPAPVEGREP